MQKTLKKRKSKKQQQRQPSTDKLTIRHILVPMDFSGFARQALGVAVPLARKHHARISLVHVVQPPVVMRTFPDGGIAMPVDIPKLRDVGREQLEKLAVQLLPDDVRGQILIRQGNAAMEVVSAAKAIKADLIALSTVGRSGLKRLLLGSTAERIVRHAPCSVLTVRRKGEAKVVRLVSGLTPHYREPLPWRRMLVPLDFSLTSLRALTVAAALAKQSRARLNLLNVVETNPYATGMEGAVLVMPDSELVNRAKKELPRIARRLVPKSVQIAALVKQGRAADVIVETAEEKGIDLIVLSTQGHTGIERLLMGSTAEGVVRHAKCPVLVVRKTRNS